MSLREVLDMPLPTFRWLASAAARDERINRAHQIADSALSNSRNRKAISAEIKRLLTPDKG